MVDNKVSAGSRVPPPAVALVAAYVVVVIGTLIALAVLQSLRLTGATTEAWVHAGIVGVFAVLLPLRLRSARRGSRSATRAIAIIAAVLMAVNAVEAALPGVFPVWMRIEMVGIALLMAALLVVAVRARRGAGSRPGRPAPMMGS